MSLYPKLYEKCSYSQLFWSVFSHIRTEYGEIFRISPYSVLMQENTEENNSEYGHFLRTARVTKTYKYETNLSIQLFDSSLK